MFKTHHNRICPSWPAVQLIQLVTQAAEEMCSSQAPHKTNISVLPHEKVWEKVGEPQKTGNWPEAVQLVSGESGAALKQM